MSRKNELFKLAKLCHSQADLTRSRAAKQTLRKIGDHYQHEAERAAANDQLATANMPWYLRHQEPAA